MKKTIISIGLGLVLLSVSLPTVTLATENEAVQQTEEASIGLRAAYKKKQFFTTTPPKTLGKLTLVKTETVKGGYYGYYN